MRLASKPVLIFGALLFALCCVGLATKNVDEPFLRLKVAQKRAPAALKKLLADKRLSECKRLDLRHQMGPHLLDLKVGKGPTACSVRAQGTATELVLAAVAPGGASVKASVHLGLPKWTSLLPPLVAILLAVILRNVFIALGAGIIAGWALGGGFPLVEVFTDPFKIKVMVFTSAILCLVTLLAKNAGMQALVDLVTRRIRSGRSSQGATVGAGVLLFFDDYANALVVGGTLKGVTDRFQVSRAKLAYLVDSTSAPIAGIALVSTWVGYEVGQIQQALPPGLGNLSGYSVFLESLPYRFYCIFTLFFVIYNVWSRREFGPMRAIEAAAQAGKDPSRSAQEVRTMVAEPDARPRLSLALIPIVVLVLGIFVGLMVDGYASLAKKPELFSVAFFRESLGAADNMQVMMIAALAVSALAIGLSLWPGRMKPLKVLKSYAAGSRTLPPTLGILILAWGLQSVTTNLDAGRYIMAAFRDWLGPATFPALIFLLSGAMAFATGTSWGTMAILIPIAAPMAVELGGAPLLIISAGAVLDGAIFGDHCSPISDTTVMSSIASGCNHLDHVRSQVPYALISMGIALAAGYAVSPQGVPPWASWLIGLGAIVLIHMTLFRRVASPGRPA